MDGEGSEKEIGEGRNKS